LLSSIIGFDMPVLKLVLNWRPQSSQQYFQIRDKGEGRRRFLLNSTLVRPLENKGGGNEKDKNGEIGWLTTDCLGLI
jgi:hypothetical protein